MPPGAPQIENPAATDEDEGPREGVISTPTEEKQVKKRVAIGAHVVYEAISRQGDQELARPTEALAWSGFAAGLSMGFSFLAEALLTAYLPHEPWRILITRAGYSLGFLIVILGRQQLFTENTLTAILPLLQRKNFRMFVTVLRLWVVVLCANLLGTFLFALSLAHIPVVEEPVRQALTEIAAGHTGELVAVVFVRAIFAGWLIALMVWLLPGAESAHVPIIIILTYVIGLGGFSHIIAGSTVMFFAALTKSISWQAYAVNFFLPTLFGNIVGGVSLVAALGHAQVVGGKD